MFSSETGLREKPLTRPWQPYPLESQAVQEGPLWLSKRFVHATPTRIYIQETYLLCVHTNLPVVQRSQCFIDLRAICRIQFMTCKMGETDLLPHRCFHYSWAVYITCDAVFPEFMCGS